MKRNFLTCLFWLAAIAGAQPTVVSLTPLNGSGSNGTFTGVFQHPAGVEKSYLSYMLFLPTPNIVWFTAKGSCLVEYNRISNGVRLIDDAATGWIGPLIGVPAGAGGTILSNQICSVNTTLITKTIAGTDVTLTIPVTFTGKPRGVMGTFLQHFDVDGNYSGMTQFGNWTANALPTGTNGIIFPTGPYVSTIGSFTQTPSGLTPAAYAKTPTSIDIVSGHTGGMSVVNMINVLIAEKILGGTNRCHIVWLGATQELKLINAAGTGFVTGAPAQNGTCQLGGNPMDPIYSTGGGNQLRIHVPVYWNPALTFPTRLSIWGNTFDNYGNLTHWVGSAGNQ